MGECESYIAKTSRPLDIELPSLQKDSRTENQSTVSRNHPQSPKQKITKVLVQSSLKVRDKRPQ